ncbi:manganese efflux pump MntP [Aneurinibacillus tyrosinisolvens]|uniref:manganese efflux pump MntP n=1 Tax=Aneurinibacillus tyrosinisolvens TaxID=1443435 RepID=UPI00063F7E29|nr:manganese efflux pump [Aneurinibacillus tyrosinisolvens]
MDWFNVFIVACLIGIGTNIDNTSIGIAYGMEKIKFPHRVNMVINFIGICTAFIGAYMGEVISSYISENTAHVVSFIVFVGIGLSILYSAYLHPRISKQISDVEPKKLGIKQGIFLGFCLSFTNIASGFGATVSSPMSLWIPVISIAVWGYIMIYLGNVIGIGVISRVLKGYSSLLAGLLLIGVGINQII